MIRYYGVMLVLQFLVFQPRKYWFNTEGIRILQLETRKCNSKVRENEIVSKNISNLISFINSEKSYLRIKNYCDLLLRNN